MAKIVTIRFKTHVRYHVGDLALKNHNLLPRVCQ